jgi:hypothetical protein
VSIFRHGASACDDPEGVKTREASAF